MIWCVRCPGSRQAALIGDLISVLLGPYDDTAAFSVDSRCRAAMGVGYDAATTLAMIVHEPATNSVKHGALSSHAGSLDITSKADDTDLTIIWSENGGPEVNEPPKMAGYGSRLMDRSVSSRFRGSLDYDWQRTGLVATLKMRKDTLAS